ncbi:hypothetical protein NFI96_029980 [Prochilodus magdalenae]|nr:hypothetical protein NFI96_029980 [Prochilodus magdalenae]
MASSVPVLLLEILEDLGRENLKTFQWHLINGVTGFKRIRRAQLEKPEYTDTVDKIVQCYEHSGAVEITLAILEKINQNQLAEDLRRKIDENEDGWEKKNYKPSALSSTVIKNRRSVNALTTDEQVRNFLIYTLNNTYERILIGNSLTGHKEYLDDFYTELTILLNKRGGDIHKHEVTQLKTFSSRPLGEQTCIKCNDLFKVQCGSSRQNRKVLTMGIAGVGKTVSVSKFIFDWVKKGENQNIKFIFPLPFRELNMRKDRRFSLIELLNNFFFTSNIKLEFLPWDDGQVLFIFDGLDECRFPLCFNDCKELKDVNEQAQLGSLITNLVSGNLLPSALIWITSRPAAAYLIPRDHLDLVTEVQGFNDEQKEEYFSKYCNEDVGMKKKMLSYIKKSRLLYIMCQIPVFCWISATVLQPLMAQDSETEIPATLTEMYTNFLLQQKQIMTKKYHKEQEAPKKPVNTDHIILKLGKLAFRTLESGDLTFCEKELRKCGIDVTGGTVFSGLCTQIFSQKFSEKNIFSFVHLSVQEYLAALYVHYKYCYNRRNVLKAKTFRNILKLKAKNIAVLHRYAVKRALRSERGHLDLFLRFLLGLSLESNQTTLQELLRKLKIGVDKTKDTTNHIKENLKEQASFDRSMNLLHCLSELKDNSMITEIQNYLTSGHLSSRSLLPRQWSALVFMLLMSEEIEEKFELKKYRPSDEGLKKLLPVIKSTRRALLDYCYLSDDGCEALTSVFSSDLPLRELDLSNNDLQSRAVWTLSDRLNNSHLKLEILRLARCNLTVNSCNTLASVLQSEHSQLKELDLSDNDLEDSGVKLISDGLNSSHCKLEILRLSGCLVTMESCSSLASALSSNPSYLKELDLTYNNPEQSGEEVLSAKLMDPCCKLETLRMEHAGENRINSGFRKYCCDLTLDPDTAHFRISLSNENKTATAEYKMVNKLPSEPEKFTYWEQVMSRESLNGRCYWECDWGGIKVEIAMTYKGIDRKGRSYGSKFGWNKNSWSLECSKAKWSAIHDKQVTNIPDFSKLGTRIGVFLDWSAGTLSYYSVSSETRKRVHTFYSKFTEPLYVGFRVSDYSTVCFCQVAPPIPFWLLIKVLALVLRHDSYTLLGANSQVYNNEAQLTLPSVFSHFGISLPNCCHLQHICKSSNSILFLPLTKDFQFHNQFIHKYERVLIGNSQTGHNVHIDDIYTNLTVVANESGGVIKHEVMQLKASSNRPFGEDTSVKCNDLFKVQPGTGRRNRKVLTMGIAGVGKTVSVSKFIFDWVKKGENQDIKFIIPLPFRELNMRKDRQFSLIELLNDFFTLKPKLESLPEDDGKVLFIFDGLDECRFHLCFNDCKELKDVNKQAPLASLITNLVSGNLLPSALIWITSRPAAAHLIPRDHLDLVTEVQGFSNEQKEAYFSKYCNEDVGMKNKIISYIQKSRILYIMCQIPVFCWISATVLQPLMARDSENEIPATLTGMYTNFLLQQKQIMMKKYHKEHEAPKNSALDTDNIILKLGKLAFRTLESGQLIFYANDLKKCGIDVTGGTVFSGLCTQIFNQEVTEKNIFSFVHLSVQEYLAALYVHYKYCYNRRNVLEPKTICNMLKYKNKDIAELHKCAVKKALENEHGHLDLFLRFLLGLSLESNQKTLQEVLSNLKITVGSVRDTTNHIKEKLNEQTSSDRSINLLHCLSELKDNSLTSEIQNSMTSGHLSSQNLSPSQWLALVFVLLMSEETEERFELKKYRPSDEGLKKLLPVMKNTRRALLDWCNLNIGSCEALASVFSSDSPLRELDLSNNDLHDEAIHLLSAELNNSNIKLEVLRLAGCNLTMNCCNALASVLQSENSHLKELDLSDNDLEDSGVRLLCDGLRSSYCKLKILRLSGCLVTQESCSFLASALSSNPSHLKELDLTYNNPGHSGLNLFSARQKDPHCKLEKLRIEHTGKNRIKPGLKKYGCELTLVPNTAHACLSLSDGNRKAACAGNVHVQQEKFQYADPERFDYWEQVLSRESLTGRCYWECEWSGVRTEIAMTYKGINRKGMSFDSRFGWNKNSWSLDCCNDTCFAYHNKKETQIPDASSLSKRIGVYLDWSAGTLSFYSVSSETRKLIHTFHSKFTEPLYAGLKVSAESSVCLCQVE